MSNTWLPTQKPSFLNEWLGLPPKESHQVLEKINLLLQDPTPDAKVKKQLKYMGGKLHRLRAGRYRIFYTFEYPYVSLLALRKRDDDTYDEEIDPEFLGGLNPDLTEVSQLQQPDWEKIFAPKEDPKTPLPEPITVDLLKRLRIPEVCHPRLLQIGDREALFDCPGIPDEIILKLDEYLFERPLVEVLQQPDFIAQDTSDLLRFKEGDLLGFLLKLNPEQEKFVTWAVNAKGPTLLKGGPGTGKSTVALYRTREILNRLKVKGVESPKILFTTYTNALVTFSEQLLEQLLGDDIRHVEVKTADSRIYSLICHETGKPEIANDRELKTILSKVMDDVLQSLPGNRLQQQAQRLILERLTPEYLIEEISTVIESRELQSLEDYQTTSRAGRIVPLNRIQRQAIWHLREHLNQHLVEQGLETWEQLRSRGVVLLRSMENPPVYDAVIVDEAQDLPPNTLRFLVQLCKAPNRLFITADANQSIYGSSFRWGNVHSDLKFVGRTGILRVNHRTTREINEAAHDYLQISLLDDEAIERQYINFGPPPAVRAVADKAAESQLLAQFCRMAAREFRLGIDACAILTPSERSGKDLAGQLNYLGLEATYMSSKDLDLGKTGVKVLTLKAAKGLEFPIVAIAGFIGSRFPYMPKGTSEEAAQEILNRERRTLFVGMTRAMRALLIVVPEKKPSILLQGFDKTLWNLGKTPA
ncbi:MAG: UvrD-helicase domain-containing protein [Leptolyngbya sp. SIO1E4]|nr:UvrD-helicase domain-containing protein [Leptolyngbya sp. SIO1E4]